MNELFERHLKIKKPQKEFLYVIKSQHFYKVGISKDIEERMKTMQTGNPIELQLHYSLELKDRVEAVELERLVHSKLTSKSLHYRGEWFLRFDTEIISEIYKTLNIHEGIQTKEFRDLQRKARQKKRRIDKLKIKYEDELRIEKREKKGKERKRKREEMMLLQELKKTNKTDIFLKLIEDSNSKEELLKLAKRISKYKSYVYTLDNNILYDAIDKASTKVK